MKKFNLILFFFLITSLAFSQKLKQIYYFDNYNVVKTGNYQLIEFDNCLQTAVTGNPTLPYSSVKLLLPQGTKANKITIIGENLTEINQEINLYPRQSSRPLSIPGENVFVVNNEIYSKSTKYPEKQEGSFETQFLNGYAICLSTFTPVVYNPLEKKASYYKKVTVEIEYSDNAKSQENCENVKTSEKIIEKVSQFVQNKENIQTYKSEKTTNSGYDILIITGNQYISSFSNLIDFNFEKGLTTEIKNITEITTSTIGIDNAEKLRNYIKTEYNENNISYVILGGDVEIVPYRGFYCHVLSGINVYEDDNIPSDLYYSSLDGTWNDNNDNLWGEIGEDDLLPEIAVGRLSFSNETELTNMLNKTLIYQQNPILGELNKPLLIDEFLTDSPETWGADYLDLLIGFQDNINGYTTTGIPETDPYETLYERDGDWSTYDLTPLFNQINSGHPFIYHSGHANSDYLMGLYPWDITNSNFSQVNGTNHNFTFLYTHGCICGSFDNDDCIAEEMVKIPNFLAGFIGNSRYGWFNQGTTDGPSTHLQREFVDALYDQKVSNIGMAHMISKLNTAPWVNAIGEFEEGATRWCFYDCNVLADPTLALWIANPYNVTASYTNNIILTTDDFFVNVKINTEIPAENYNCTVFQNGTIIGQGITDVSGNVTITFDENFVQSGSATLIVSGYNILNTEYNFIISTETGICKDLFADNNFNFTSFPNPFNDYVVLNYEISNNESIKIELFDIYGKSIKVILNDKISQGQHSIKNDLSDLQTGVYFFKITIGEKSFSEKIIKL